MHLEYKHLSGIFIACVASPSENVTTDCASLSQHCMLERKSKLSGRYSIPFSLD